MASVWLEPHGKAVLVKGDTMMIKDLLKTKGGKWNAGLKSWLFPGSKKASCGAAVHGICESMWNHVHTHGSFNRCNTECTAAHCYIATWSISV
ncbi:SUB1 [Symbiodinium natans]|uniref:SUB1 protein n=1 Tax=Symbiodinium natans TaxID=878477 RepID=A0A812I5V9_9DINO|nr:SUB1 [Symbiodinium natans]